MNYIVAKYCTFCAQRCDRGGVGGEAPDEVERDGPPARDLGSQRVRAVLAWPRHAARLCQNSDETARGKSQTQMLRQTFDQPFCKTKAFAKFHQLLAKSQAKL